MSAAEGLMGLARVTASLLVVLVLAVLVARLARRATYRGPGVGLRVLERTGLSREASVAVVEVAGQGLVLGVTARAVSVLAQLDGDQLAAARAAAPEHSQPSEDSEFSESSTGLAPPAPDGPRGARRPAARPPGTGALFDPRTWRQGIEALRDLTTRRG